MCLRKTRQFHAANFHVPFGGEYIHVSFFFFVIFNYHQSAFVFVLNADYFSFSFSGGILSHCQTF